MNYKNIQGENDMKKNKRAMAAGIALVTAVFLSGCSIAGLKSKLNDIKGELIGSKFECQFYDNYGERFLTVEGKKVDMTGNVVEESVIDDADGSVSKGYALSSVVTVEIDGKEISSCGDTIIFQEDGLEPDVDFQLEDIKSTSHGAITENTKLSGIINKYKNYFGKAQVVVIQSQMGVPICAYSGDDVYWEIQEDLPKTTKLMVDGNALYIHRANFQIIDQKLIKN